MSDIFISYSREDRPRAKRIAEELERRGWSVWWDRMIPAGKVFDDVIEQAIRDAKCIIVLWSSHSVGSRWVRSEASEGADRQILVPVLIEEVPIPLAFKRIQAADLTMWRDGVLPPSFEKLVADINALPGLARPGEGVQPQQADVDVSAQDAGDAVSEEHQEQESPGGGEERETAEGQDHPDDQHYTEHTAGQVGTRRAGGFWYGIATALSVVIIAGVGFWLYTTQLAPQAPVQVKPTTVKPDKTAPQPQKPKVQVPLVVNPDLFKTLPRIELKTSPAETGSTPSETKPPEPTRPEPTPVLSPFENALVKYRGRETTSVDINLKAQATEGKGDVVSASIDSPIKPGRHAWLISGKGCWYTELYNPSHGVITNYSLRIKMEKSDELAALVERSPEQIDEALQELTITTGSRSPCSGYKDAHAVIDLNTALLDRAVQRSEHVDRDIKLRARAMGDGVSLKFLTKHGMSTSNYIKHLGVYLNGKPVAYLAWSPLVSENPHIGLTFSGTGKKGDDLQVGWIDSRGRIAVSEKLSIK